MIPRIRNLSGNAGYGPEWLMSSGCKQWAHFVVGGNGDGVVVWVELIEKCSTIVFVFC